MKNFIKNIINKNDTSENYIFGNDIPLSWIKVKTSDICKRISFVSFCMYAIFIIITIRLYSLCIGNYIQSDIKPQTSKTNISFYRPDIIDRNGELLARNLPTWNLYANPREIINPERTVDELIKIRPNLDKNKLLNDLKSDKKFVYIDRKINPRDQEKITLIGEPALQFEHNESRVYPQDAVFAHVIGNVNMDNKGVSGIEKYIDEKNLTNSKQPIQLSVDVYIQNAIRSNLLNAMKEYGAKQAAGIIMDVKTGEVLGLVSLPDFYNSEYGTKFSDTYYSNHVTLDAVEPGSVMKIFNTALALENNYPEDKLFNVLNIFKIGSFRVQDSHPKKSYLNLLEGFIYSSNIVMANVAKDLGIPKQVAFLDKLNLLNKMDFELPELTSPVYDKAWNEYTSASVGYGYGLAVTMLHVVTAVNAIVNDGLYIYPTLLKRKPEEILKSFQVVSSKTSKRIRELMRKVITDGTGYMANMKNIQVGGKTGTAKKNLSWGGYERDKFKTYFVSVFPINDPKYTMLIMLDEAVNKGCTSSACTTVPISAKIIDEITPVLNLDLKIGL